MALPLREPEPPTLRLLPRPRHRRVRRILLIAVVSTLVPVLALGGIAWVRSPRPTDPSSLVRARLATLGEGYVRLPSIAPEVRLAVVATEDERFYRHHGVDLIGVARAVAYDVSHFSLSQGASTITEQLAKVLYLGGDDRSPWRKLEDAAVAVRMETHLSKEQILELYLNAVFMGGLKPGIGSASERCFGVPPSRLDLGQASLLAGLIQAPTADDPFAHPLAARERQAIVLASMVRNGFTTPAEAAQVMATPLRLRDGTTLPPMTGLVLTPGAHVSGLQLEIGVLLLVVGLIAIAIVAGRRRRVGRTIGSALLVVGLVVMARSMRVA